ncbi:MAG: class I SAM-dependent methyltransferase [Saprospiraceae bacterium]
MSKWFYRIGAFFKYYNKASTVYGIHSPFVYDFIVNILDTSKEYYAYKNLEAARWKLMQSNKTIMVDDFGAGSQVLQHKVKERKVKDIAKSALSSKNKCRILFQLINHYSAKEILELGTSLGLSSGYMAASVPSGKITTLEGSAEIAKIAAETHKSLGSQNIKIIQGNFINTLHQVLHQQFDVIFIDGHHEYSAVMTYFEALKPTFKSTTIVIIDDIYWSEGMEKAWHELKNTEGVTVSIDVFEVGILFFNPQLIRQDFTLIAYKYKPWKLGIWGK